MALGNKGFAGLVAGDGEGAAGPRRPPRTGFLGARETRLTELAAGALVTRVHEAIDPELCRIWDGHNRDYAALDERICGDLIDSLRAQGRQEVPAIVRRVKGDPSCQFEVICGARRHWSVRWLRAHDYPDFKFVVEPRELSDEEAFRIADLENRSRKDLSDYERATDYARAIERYYDGSQQRMVDRLSVTKSWLSRYLELARLPLEVLTCFVSPHAIGITHAAAIAPAMSHPLDRQRVLREAAAITAEQHARREQGSALIPPSQVVARLVGTRRSAAGAAPHKEVLDSAGVTVLSVVAKGRGGVVFTIPADRVKDRDAVLRAVDQCLKALALTDDKGTGRGRQRR